MWAAAAHSTPGALPHLQQQRLRCQNQSCVASAAAPFPVASPCPSAPSPPSAICPFILTSLRHFICTPFALAFLFYSAAAAARQHLLAMPRILFSILCLPLATLVNFAFTLGKDFCQRERSVRGGGGGTDGTAKPAPTKAKSFICTVFFFLNFCCAAAFTLYLSTLSTLSLCPGVKCLLAICTNMFTYTHTRIQRTVYIALCEATCKASAEKV